MNIDVKLEPTGKHLERLTVTVDQGYLVGNVGSARAIADTFGNAQNPARWAFLKSLKAKTAWIDRIYVSKEARRQGIGTELFVTVLDGLTEIGVRYVVLSPRPEHSDDYDALEKFYAKFGFVEIRQWKGQTLWSRLLVLDLDSA